MVISQTDQTDHNLVKVLHAPLMSAAFGAYSRILQNVFHVCRVFSQEKLNCISQLAAATWHIASYFHVHVPRLSQALSFRLFHQV